jgi:hypothetical protein
VKVRLDAPAGQVNQEGGNQHLAHRNHVARDRLAGASDSQEHGQGRDHASQSNRREHVRVYSVRRARPGSWGNPNRGRHAGQPLDDQQNGKIPVRAPVDRLLIVVQQFSGAPRNQTRGVHVLVATAVGMTAGFDRHGRGLAGGNYCPYLKLAPKSIGRIPPNCGEFCGLS